MNIPCREHYFTHEPFTNCSKCGWSSPGIVPHNHTHQNHIEEIVKELEELAHPSSERMGNYARITAFIHATNKLRASILTYGDQRAEEGAKAERERIKEVVEFERVSFWGTKELEDQTKINNTVVDNILKALTPPNTTEYG